MQVKQYTRSMGRRGRSLSTSLEHIPKDQTTVTGQLSMDTRFTRKLPETYEGALMFRSKTRTLSPMSEANAKEAKVPTYIRWY